LRRLRAPAGAETFRKARFMFAVQSARAAQEFLAGRREVQRVGAAIVHAFVAYREFALLEFGEKRTEVRLLDAERAADLGLRQSRILIDDHEHAVDGRPQLQFAERGDEVGERDDLRAAQCVTDEPRERPKLDRRHAVTVAVTRLARRGCCALQPWIHALPNRSMTSFGMGRAWMPSGFSG